MTPPTALLDRPRLEVEALIAAASAQPVRFDDVPAEPVASAAGALDAEARSQIAHRYGRHGFAVVRLDPTEATPEGLDRLAEALQLGPAFLPPLYARGAYAGEAISQITVNRDNVAHPSFGRAVGLHMHCDGTLQKLGDVKTSILICQTAGADGGDTTLFNASAAFAALLDLDRPAALALAHPQALIRQANMNGSSDVNQGPAFAVQDGVLVCGYSVTATDRWVIGEGVDVEDLRRGAMFLRHAAARGSPYFLQLRLEAGDAILLANTRISHGRTAYFDAPDQRRCLFRGLYLREPAAPARAAGPAADSVAAP